MEIKNYWAPIMGLCKNCDWELTTDPRDHTGPEHLQLTQSDADNELISDHTDKKVDCSATDLVIVSWPVTIVKGDK